METKRDIFKMGKSMFPPEIDVKSLSDEEFLKKVKEINLINIKKGVENRWWESVDEKGRPIPFPIILKFDDFTFPGATMAHIMCEAKLFASVSDARKKGWNKPVQKGKFVVGKFPHFVVIE